MKPAAIRDVLLTAALVVVIASTALLYEHHRWSRSVEARTSKILEQVGLHSIQAARAAQDTQARLPGPESSSMSILQSSTQNLDQVIADDTPEALEGVWSAPVNDVDKRTPVQCRRSGKQAVIVILGQSNAANSGEGLTSAPAAVSNFNIYDGRCYVARDPLLGTTGKGSNFATVLGRVLVENKLFDNVVLAPIAVDGTRIEHWAPFGYYNHKIVVLLKRLRDAGLSPDYIFWHQGEGDRDQIDLGGYRYRHRLLEVVATFRTYGIHAPFFVARATYCNSNRTELATQNVRDAQLNIANAALDIFSGPDTDALGDEFRYDKCHFNAQGIARHAELWARVLEKFVSSRLPAALNYFPPQPR